MKRAGTESEAGHASKRHKSADNNAEDGTDVNTFEVMQAYRRLQAEVAKDRVQSLRSGEIENAAKHLEEITRLYEQIKQQKDNGLFMQDSRTIMGISELAELSVRNMKLGEVAGIVNVQDTIGYFKRYMLEDYFKSRDIKETFESTAAMEADVGDAEEQPEDAEEQTAGSRKAQQLNKTTQRRNYLQQFDHYNSFEQFNWCKLSGLFTELTRTPATTDNLIGPFAYEKKVRVKTVRQKNTDVVGELVKPDNPTGKDLADNDENSTPDQVRRCYKALTKRLGKGNSMSLFQFVIDPKSFSRSVENLFYTSFLIKEGRIVMEEDPENGYPIIRLKESAKGKDKHHKEMEKEKQRNARENHIIFQMDMPTWSKLIEKFNITASFLDLEH
ncbi:Smc5-Smc6 complex subunit [Maudiozyma humilis]|uniref:Non-structural maintenance of chromosomes element 4 n=1 Tax=Maudiozyma humilis TaxID=51915 RepID=A0AAV5RQ65_MAUHU|nr:Smc5-Smc6 complex subunit [Kazachstania humilis]